MIVCFRNGFVAKYCATDYDDDANKKSGKREKKEQERRF